MKVFVCLFALIACVSASTLHHADVVAAPAVVHAPALLSTGSSTQSRTQDAAGNYAFAYNEQHATGGSSRSESGAPGVAQGSYTLNVADGRSRVVNYVADALGFRAAIATNEPGTAAQPAASTAIASPHAPPAPVAPLAVAAPVAVAHAPAVVHAEPVVAHAPVLAAHVPVAHAPAHVVAVAPAISSYSTAINHVNALPAVHVAAPVVHHAVAHSPVLAHHAPLLAHHAPVLAAPALHYRK